MLRCPIQIRRTAIRLIAGAAVMMAVGGCAVKHPSANLVSGKVMFQKTCGGCHTLAHANSSGTTGPNLDDAFRQDKSDGVKSTSIQGLVDSWIRYPNTQGVMPAGLLKGQDAQAAAGGLQATTPAAGKQVFTGVGACGSCHTLAAAGTTGTVGPNLDQDLKTNCAT